MVLAPILGTLAMLAGVLTTWVVNTRPASEQDPDARFWYVFTGACVVAPLVLGATVVDRWIGVATLATVAGTVLAANNYSSRIFRRRLDAEHASILAAVVFLVMLIMLLFVVPVFTKTFQDAGAPRLGALRTGPGSGHQPPGNERRRQPSDRGTGPGTGCSRGPSPPPSGTCVERVGS